MSKTLSRRTFLRNSAVVAGAGVLLPQFSIVHAAGDKLRHACVGVGGMGRGDLESLLGGGKVQVVAICDVDEGNLNAAAEFLKTKAGMPDVRLYRDWRVMLEKEDKNIDSVNVSTPDHQHAPVAMSAIQRGKHTYCQKPLTHTVYEARQLTLAARKMGVVTQMGIQIHADITYRLAVAIVQDGAIGKVTEWHSWQSSGAWATGGRPEGSDPVPPQLDWDQWIGVAPMRPFKADIYHPARWRGWQDFGCGVLGDFACHIFDPVFTALQVGPCLTVRTEAPAAEINNETFPSWQIVHYEFAATKWTQGPTVKGTWYNGEVKLPRELAPMPAEYNLPKSGSLIVGTEGVMVLPHWAGPQLYPLEKFKAYKRPDIKGIDHYQQWVDACLGKGKAEANFDYSGPMTETVLLGNVGLHFAGKTLNWDAEKMQITNVPAANQRVRKTYRSGWEVKGLS